MLSIMQSSSLNQLTEILSQQNPGSTSASSLFDMSNLLAPAIPMFIILGVVTVLFAIVYILSAVDKWRANKAILDIRRILTEMNDRQKGVVPTTQAQPPVGQSDQSN